MVHVGHRAVDRVGDAVVARKEVVAAQAVDEHAGDERGHAHVLGLLAEAVAVGQAVDPAAAVGVLLAQRVVGQGSHRVQVAVVEAQFVGSGQGEHRPACGAAAVGVADELVFAVLDKLGEVGADLLDRLAQEGVAREEVVPHEALGPDVAEVERVEARVGGRGAAADAVLDE